MVRLKYQRINRLKRNTIFLKLITSFAIVHEFKTKSFTFEIEVSI